MVQTINTKTYGKLLAKAQPRRIESEEQNEQYLKLVEDLIDKGSENFSPEEHAFFDLLVTLIEEFEERTYPMPKISPHERIKYLLKEQGYKQKDLVGVLGSEGVVSDIVSGKRSLSLKSIHRLADFFHVPVDLFV